VGDRDEVGWCAEDAGLEETVGPRFELVEQFRVSCFENIVKLAEDVVFLGNA